jgi:hypothetical protein
LAQYRQRSTAVSSNLATRNVEAFRFFVDPGFNTVGHVDLFRDLSQPTAREWKQGVAIHGKDLKY